MVDSNKNCMGKKSIETCQYVEFTIYVMYTIVLIYAAEKWTLSSKNLSVWCLLNLLFGSGPRKASTIFETFQINLIFNQTFKTYLGPIESSKNQSAPVLILSGFSHQIKIRIFRSHPKSETRDPRKDPGSSKHRKTISAFETKRVLVFENCDSIGLRDPVVVDVANCRYNLVLSKGS